MNSSPSTGVGSLVAARVAGQLCFPHYSRIPTSPEAAEPLAAAWCFPRHLFHLFCPAVYPGSALSLPGLPGAAAVTPQGSIQSSTRLWNSKGGVCRAAGAHCRRPQFFCAIREAAAKPVHLTQQICENLEILSLSPPRLWSLSVALLLRLFIEAPFSFFVSWKSMTRISVPSLAPLISLVSALSMQTHLTPPQNSQTSAREGVFDTRGMHTPQRSIFLTSRICVVWLFSFHECTF